MTDTTQHVLVWSCGPVQEFIKAGRKGRDLWFGSWLLSELSRAAALAAMTAGATLIHPAPRDLAALKNEHFNVSNKLLVLTGTPGAMARAMETAARERLSALFQQVRGKIEKVQRGFSDLKIHWDVAEAQVRDLPEFYWASAPQTKGFAEARQVAEAMHAGAKAHRVFKQPPWKSGEKVPKSSLDGARESVVDEKVYGWKEKGGREHPADEDALRALKLQGKERLCGVGLLKRWGAETQTGGTSGSAVLSTSHVASWTTRKAWDRRPELASAMQADFAVYIQKLKDLGADLSHTPHWDPVLKHEDGHVLFENRLVDVLEEDELKGKQALRELFSAWKDRVKEHNKTLPKDEKTTLLPPTPYYAVLVADGDKVGAALDILSKQKDGVEALQHFTRVLENFANAAAKMVQEQHHGHAVYTGGDDVLALLPVETALECARDLKEGFARAMRMFSIEFMHKVHPEDALEKDVWKQIGADQPTLSAGICIAHHTDPLQNSLDYARKAETLAKQKCGRNAWYIILAKRSGAPLELGGKWEVVQAAPEAAPGKGGKKSATYADLEALVKLYKEEVLPRGLPYDLREAGLALKDLTDDEAKKAGKEKDYSRLRAAEAKRILLQKRIVKRPDFEKPDPHPLVAQSQSGDLEGLAHRLILARFLAQPEEDRA